MYQLALGVRWISCSMILSMFIVCYPVHASEQCSSYQVPGVSGLNLALPKGYIESCTFGRHACEMARYGDPSSGEIARFKDPRRVGGHFLTEADGENLSQDKYVTTMLSVYYNVGKTGAAEIFPQAKKAWKNRLKRKPRYSATQLMKLLKQKCEIDLGLIEETDDSITMARVIRFVPSRDHPEWVRYGIYMETLYRGRDRVLSLQVSSNTRQFKDPESLLQLTKTWLDCLRQEK